MTTFISRQAEISHPNGFPSGKLSLETEKNPPRIISPYKKFDPETSPSRENSLPPPREIATLETFLPENSATPENSPLRKFSHESSPHPPV